MKTAGFKALLIWSTVMWAVFALFSYSLAAPNLVLTSWQPYWQLQTYLWQTLFNNRSLLSEIYALLIVILTLNYAAVVWGVRRWSISLTQVGWGIAICTLPLLLSNNALSYDLFNYVFNAKMVVVYHANPHLQTALEFAQDPWVRFMHNVHTPAPYGYSWTALSLIPYSLSALLSGNRFTLILYSFRFWSWLSLGLLFMTLRWFSRRLDHPPQPWLWALVFFNPLLLIEILSSAHNDLWMMIPALWALGLLLKQAKKSPVWLWGGDLGSDPFVFHWD